MFLPRKHCASMVRTLVDSNVSRTTSLYLSRPQQHFGTSNYSRRSEISSEPGITAVSSQKYTAPLMKTVRNIKFFSLSSLALSTLISPVFFIIDSEIEPAVRIIMVGIALGTSALSTAVIQWVLKPYVIEGKRLNSIGDEAFVFERLSWLGQRRSITVNPQELVVEKNGRMFSNLKSADGDCFYIHETTKFWKDLTDSAKKSETSDQV